MFTKFWILQFRTRGGGFWSPAAPR